MRWEKRAISVLLWTAPSDRHQEQVVAGIRMWSGIAGPRVDIYREDDSVGGDVVVRWIGTLSDDEMERDGQTRRTAAGDALRRCVIVLPKDVPWGLRRPWWSLDYFRQDLATVVAHEFGHALGLPHYPGGLLAEGGPGRRVNSIPAVDRAALAKLYERPTA